MPRALPPAPVVLGWLACRAVAQEAPGIDLPKAQEALQRAMLRQLLARRGGTGDIR
jgi:hypothetical protein